MKELSLSPTISKPTYRGKVRLFLHKTDKDQFEEMDREHFEDALISDVTDRSDAEIISYELDNAGLYSLEDQIKEEIIIKYSIDDFVEILADFHFEGWVGDTPCGIEYDSHSWLENCKHRKLTEYQALRFCNIPEYDITFEGEE